MLHQYPQTVCFAVLQEQMPKPTIVIERDGKLRPKNPDLYRAEVRVLLEMKDDWIDITSAQYRTMIQLSRVVLHHQPLAQIVFNGGASPWGLDHLPQYNQNWASVADAIGMRPTKIQKVLVRKKPLHPIIKQRQAKLRHGPLRPSRELPRQS